LSKEILFGKLINGGIVEIGVDNDKLVLNYVDVLPVSKEKIKEEVADADTDN
jgi:hypothetical protein